MKGRKFYPLILLFICLIFTMMPVCNSGVINIDRSFHWDYLGNSDGRKFYADLNPVNIIYSHGIIEYNLMSINSRFDGMIYVYQVNIDQCKARFVHRYVVEDNDIVDDWTWVQPWEDIPQNCYIMYGAKKARMAVSQ